MANTVAIRKLLDGPKDAILQVYIASDGSSGELSAVVVVDASDLAGAPTALSVVSVEYGVTGFSGVMAFDATTDAPFLVLPADTAYKQCFKEFGGIANPKSTGYTGDILLTTTGFTAAGDYGHLTIHVRKD